MNTAAGSINWLAALLAAVLAFVIGGAWYSPALFGKVWMRETGLTEAQLAQGNPAKIFGLSFLLSLIAAVVFALFLGPTPSLGLGLGAGASAGACWVAAAFGINYLFERRSLTLFLINGGYNVVTFTVFGLVLGLWH